MARKKQESGPSGGNAPWMNTFADLMNLLLCFFVLLFAFSNVDNEKFEEISISMANSIGVFEAGASSVGVGQLISSGISQLNNLNDLFNSMGKTVEGDSDTSDINNTEQGVEGTSGSDDIMDNGEELESSLGAGGGSSTGSSQGSSDSVEIKEALDKLQKEMQKETTAMYDRASDLSDDYNLGDFVELNMDSEFQYVELSLKGSVLYASGDAELKKAAEPILMKIGNILTKFEDYSVEIIGHTDNVPMTSSTYKDNNWLSSARALNAAEFLINNCDINPDRLKYSGRGEYDPIASNATAEGRAKNRRIEIRIYNQYSGH